ELHQRLGARHGGRLGAGEPDPVALEGGLAPEPVAAVAALGLPAVVDGQVGVGGRAQGAAVVRHAVDAPADAGHRRLRPGTPAAAPVRPLTAAGRRERDEHGDGGRPEQSVPVPLCVHAGSTGAGRDRFPLPRSLLRDLPSRLTSATEGTARGPPAPRSRGPRRPPPRPPRRSGRWPAGPRSAGRSRRRWAGCPGCAGGPPRTAPPRGAGSAPRSTPRGPRRRACRPAAGWRSRGPAGRTG